MIPGANAGVNYYRMASWAWQMRKHKNVQVAVFAYQHDRVTMQPWQIDFATNPVVRKQLNSLCEMADIVIWHPVHYNNTLDFFLEMQALHDKPMLVDMDDNYIDVPPWNEAFASFGPGSSHRKLAMEMLRIANGVIVATPHLKTIYEPYNRNIHLVENSLDLTEWDELSIPRHQKIRIGWIGGRSHVRDLLIVTPILRDILQKYPKTHLYLINSGLKNYSKFTGRPDEFEGIPNVYYSDRSVSINLYPRFMAHFKFDIGLAPLEDCNFNRSKSNLRWLEYSALKIPTIATDISHFNQTVTTGETGILIPGNDTDAWHRALEEFIGNEDFRSHVGQNAYRTIKQRFNLRKNAGAYLRLLRDIASHGSLIPGDPNDSEPALCADR
jgi:glycosyltransferase involved in cell wall biosynthesis